MTAALSKTVSSINPHVYITKPLLVQVKLLKRILEKLMEAIREQEQEDMEAKGVGNSSESRELYNELLAAIKELIEISEKQNEKYLYLGQASRFVDKVNFNVNLDYLKWLISFSWNYGVQLYK